MKVSMLRGWIKRYGSLGYCMVAAYFFWCHIKANRRSQMAGCLLVCGLFSLIFHFGTGYKPIPSVHAVPVIHKQTQQQLDDALFEAIDHSDRETVKHLLTEGANPNAISSTDTPLSAAIGKEDPVLVLILLEAKADPNFTGDIQYNERPLSYAAGQENYAIVKLLVEHGADASFRSAERGKSAANGNDGSALYYASKQLAFHPHSAEAKHILAYLIQHGAKTRLER